MQQSVCRQSVCLSYRFMFLSDDRRFQAKYSHESGEQWGATGISSLVSFPRFTAIKTSALICHPETQEALRGNVKSWFKDAIWCRITELISLFSLQISEIPLCFYAHDNISKHLRAVKNPDVQLFMHSSTCFGFNIHSRFLQKGSVRWVTSSVNVGRKISTKSIKENIFLMRMN